MKTTDRVALVSGGNRGIGLEICRGLEKLGFRVALGSRDPASGEQAIAQLGLGRNGVVMVAHLDVTDAESVRDAVAHVSGRWGRIDVLVNNAGVYLDEADSGQSVLIEAVRETLETNLIGALRLCQAVIPGMVERRFGRIVNVSSGYGASAHMDEGGVLAYKLSKLGLNGLTRILAAELRDSGILVNAVDPGWARTRMGGAARRTPRQAADTALYLATLPSSGPSGRFFRDRRPISW